MDRRSAARNTGEFDVAERRSPDASAWGRLALAVCVLAILWLLVLPWFGQQAATKQRIEQFQRQGVNPGAMYYTELEMLPELLERLEEVHRRHGAAFWKPSH